VRGLIVPSLPKVPNVQGLEHEKRKAELETWVAQVTNRKEEFLVKIESETVVVNKEYATMKQALEKWYREQLETLNDASDKWIDEADEKLKDVDDELELLELRRGGDDNRNNAEENKPNLVSLIHCPITGNVMVDPVTAADGCIYERSAIEDLF